MSKIIISYVAVSLNGHVIRCSGARARWLGCLAAFGKRTQRSSSTSVRYLVFPQREIITNKKGIWIGRGVEKCKGR